MDDSAARTHLHGKDPISSSLLNFSRNSLVPEAFQVGAQPHRMRFIDVIVIIVVLLKVN